MIAMNLCLVILLYGAFTISSSIPSTPASNSNLLVGFLSYHDDATAPANRDTYDECQGACRLVFEASLHDQHGSRIGPLQTLTLASLVKGSGGVGVRYLGVDGATKPVSFDVPDQTSDVTMHVRIYKNISTGDENETKIAQGADVDLLVYTMDVQGSSDFFSLVDIGGKQRPEATLHLAIRFVCNGVGCLDDCVTKRGIQSCIASQGGADPLKHKYTSNPFARCPSQNVIPPVNPTPSSSQSPNKSTDSTTTATTTTTSTTTPGTTTTSPSFQPPIHTSFSSNISPTSSSSTSLSTSSSPSSSPSSPHSSVILTTFHTTSTTAMVSPSSQHNEETSTFQQSQSTNAFSPANTESSQTPDIYSSQTTIVESTQLTPSTTNTDTERTTNLLQSSIDPNSLPLHTSLSFLDTPSPTIRIDDLSSTQSESESISPTSTHKSCKCTKTKTQNYESTTHSVGNSQSTAMSNEHASSSPVTSSLDHLNTDQQTLTTTKTLDITPNVKTPSTVTQHRASTITPALQPTHLAPSTTIHTIPSSSLPLPTQHDSTQQATSSRTPTSNGQTSTTIPVTTQSGQPPFTSPQTSQSPFLPVESPEDSEDAMAYWAIIVGSVLGGLAVVGIIGYLLYRSRQTSLRKHQELYTVTPQMISTIEENGTAGRSDVPMTTALL